MAQSLHDRSSQGAELYRKMYTPYVKYRCDIGGNHSSLQVLQGVRKTWASGSGSSMCLDELRLQVAMKDSVCTSTTADALTSAPRILRHDVPGFYAILILRVRI